MKGVILFFFLATLASVCVSEETPLIGAKHAVEPASIEHWVDTLREEHGLNISSKYVIHDARVQVVNGILYDFFLEDQEHDTLQHIVFITQQKDIKVLKHVEIAEHVSEMNKNKVEELMKEYERENHHDLALVEDLEQDQEHEDEHENYQVHESEPVENELEELEEIEEPAEEVESV